MPSTRSVASSVATCLPCSLILRTLSPLSLFLLSSGLEGGSGRRAEEGDKLERDVPSIEAMCGSSRRSPLFVNGICRFTSQATSQVFCKLYKQGLAGY